MLDYSGIATKVRSLGPGERVVLWVRGCSIGCPGCMTSDLWASREPRPLEPLADELASALATSDGLTISGGEPFEQAEQLVLLLLMLRSKIQTNVLCYSGFTWERLKREEQTRALLGEIDMLIDGAYRREEQNTKSWRGSDNQRLILLSEYAKSIGHTFPETEDVRELQLQRLPDGAVRIIGIPRRKDMEQLKVLMLARGLQVKEAS